MPLTDAGELEDWAKANPDCLVRSLATGKISTALNIDEAIKLAEAIAFYVSISKIEDDLSPHLESLSNKFTSLVLQIPLNRSTDEDERANTIILSIDPSQGIDL